MVADTASIRAELEGLHNLPTPVREWRVEEGLDATDDPAVWVWAMIEGDDVDADALRRLKAMARSVVRDATGLWGYILIRGADETEATVSLPRDLLAQATFLRRKRGAARDRPACAAVCQHPTTRCSTSWWTHGAWSRAAVAMRCETASAAPSTTE